MIWVHFWGLGTQSLQGHTPFIFCVPRVHFYEILGSQGDLGAPLGHSLGPLFVELRALWQHMLARLVCGGTQCGNWRLNVLKVTSTHLAGCGQGLQKAKCGFPKASQKATFSNTAMYSTLPQPIRAGGLYIYGYMYGYIYTLKFVFGMPGLVLLGVWTYFWVAGLVFVCVWICVVGV